MPKNKSNGTDLPKNKQGGLNLNWAITQALNKLGEDAKISDVREYIVVNYKNLGRKAVENAGSLSTGISSMRKKMRDESKKVPPVPVSTNGHKPSAPQAASKPDVTPTSVAATGTSAVFGTYVKTTLKPALAVVRAALDAAFKERSKDDLNKLKAAIAEVESAQKVFGDEVPTICAMVE